MSNDAAPTNVHMEGINRGRLFLGSCFALIATSVFFAMIGAIMEPLKEQFLLSNALAGVIGGAALWGFTVSMVVFGPLCDALGMKNLLRIALFGHAAGVLIMVGATFVPGAAFWILFIGALVVAMGNGLVEAACNPLVATIYPEKKTQKLNQFHVWFPGGIVIGGLIAKGLDNVGIVSWQVKVLVVLIPTVIYGLLFLKQKFPVTERVQSGVSHGEMVKATLARPLFLLLFLCMAMTASLELPVNRWLPAFMGAGGIDGLLLLTWISLLMAVLRFFAGPVVERLAPTGTLVVSTILAGIGLFWLGSATTSASAWTAATVFALGICYFWPTMLGVVSERVPKGGALALALMGGVGMAVPGLIATPGMGRIADVETHAYLEPAQTEVVLAQVAETLPGEGEEAVAARDLAEEVLEVKAETGEFPPVETANALRGAIGVDEESEAGQAAEELLKPAEFKGGRKALRTMSMLAIPLFLIFGALFLKDKASGGYKAEKLHMTDEARETPGEL